MNNRQKEILQSQLKDEQQVLKELKQVYAKAREDVIANIKALEARTDLENLQGIIYQKQYQNALKRQLDAILDTMNAQQFTTLSDYLSKSYEDGFFGVLYDLHGQGIPLIFPIDQKQAARAIQLDSKISEGLYQRLGVDTKQLKDSIRANVSRGIASNTSWADVARNIENRFGVGLNKTMRIARTEGHRIQGEAQFDAQKAAKDKGADVVKQWDATLDARTRPDHAALDGQIREVEEPFEIKGYKAMFPGGFGVAAEDINCRCRSNQRAKWALDEDELKTLRERATYFGLDKTESFEDFKTKYIKLQNGVTAKDLSEDLQERLVKYTQGKYSNICDYSQYLIDPDQLNHDKAWFEKHILPTIPDEDKEYAESILKIIDGQPIKEVPLYRIERGLNPVNEGEIINFGIRSTTRDSEFANKVYNDLMEGFNSDSLNFNGQWTEYRFINSRSLDISDVSSFSSQAEELISGSYEVVKVETIENIKRGLKDITVSVKDVAENVQYFVSKSGKNMVRYVYDDETHTDTLEKFETRTDTVSKYQEGQFGRKVVWVKLK